MRIIVALSLVILTQSTLAAKCEPVLSNLVKILTNKGDLAPDKNTYARKFSANEFSSSCELQHGGQDYTLYLHPDNVTIVVAHIEPKTNVVMFKGPFYSAYKK
ncbi:hypothetical protein [uncultured Pseudoteredinibacter sp.]|uniref:hypothetical protein n=1 Tax=uncultured Pseudoteredinibacter sp. TaxID=1641701 RepID=UPI0026242EE4|nr:hypothetical protein [uncultured Pseudoteredinibacter sp.]